jgi:hypothetical protein
MNLPKNARRPYRFVVPVIVLALHSWMAGCGGGSSYSSTTVTAPTPTLSSITITPASPTVVVGSAEQFALTATYSDGSTQNLTSSAIWTSSQSSIATINSSGFASSKSGGVTIITAASGSLSSSMPLVVTPATPGYGATGNLQTGRVVATATLLNNGSVLIAGGNNVRGGPSLSSAEMYDPVAATFTLTGSLNTPRSGHTATLLNNGMVLVVGGSGSSTNAELFNPTAGTFSLTGTLSAGRFEQTATLLPNGMVLIAGGYDLTSAVLASAELYNPTTGSFTLTGSMQAARQGATATLLNNGTVLVAGGSSDTSGDFPLTSAEIYNPTTGLFASTGSLVTARSAATAALLNNGNVLIAGGSIANTTTTGSAEIFNATNGTFSATGSLSNPRTSHSMTLLNNGTVLVTGGANFSTGIPLLVTAISTSELYNPATGTFAAGANLNTARLGQTARLLNNGTVLVAGGAFFTGQTRNVLSSAELYVPGTFTPPNLVSIKINPVGATLSVSGNQRFTATGTFNDNSTQTLSSVNWSSPNGSLISVSNDSSNSGVATGVAVGNATVAATAGSITGSTTVTVH